MKQYIMVIDEGTTGTRAIIFDDNFQPTAQSYDEFIQYTPNENMVEHDAMEIYEKSVRMCQNALEKASLSASDIRCIGITNQRNTALLWDKKTGEPLYHALVWQDSRMGEASNAIRESEFFDELLEVSGKNVTPHLDVLFLKWFLDNVEGAREKVESGEAIFGTIDTWLVWKLTGGKVHATSFSNASSSGCMDIKNEKWFSRLFDYVGVPESVFPKIKSESDDYGMTDVFGVPIPITGVIADQQSALFAQGCTKPGSIDGGASENNLLAQMIADYCNASVLRPESVEATSLGAALMAAMYMGDITLDEVERVTASDAVFTPNMDSRRREEEYKIWKEAVTRSLNWIKH
ncbi:FGGY family carbohydrate kinase [Eubacterium callanderi]|uniref:FGGY family carbohydrate kinase n=1 Tax=Eubacterium callanderi TaxID=53442 RepID=UPI00399B73E9